MKDGDTVHYAPHQVHFFDEDEKGDFAWRFGWVDRYDADGNPSAVRELPNVELRRKVRALKRRRGHAALQVAKKEAAEMRGRLNLVKLNKAWTAVVRGVSEDGKTADLDIKAGRPGITLHYDSVPIVQLGQEEPHTCFATEVAVDKAP
ncbi:MAG: hypothetical protein KGL39_25705 [Patescibacteria group bacterium]|nr:hypothetical protein [Patescibacteria group bacterium]